MKQLSDIAAVIRHDKRRGRKITYLQPYVHIDDEHIRSGVVRGVRRYHDQIAFAQLEQCTPGSGAGVTAKLINYLPFGMLVHGAAVDGIENFACRDEVHNNHRIAVFLRLYRIIHIFTS